MAQLRDALEKNASTILMLNELRTLFDKISHDTEVYAIVLSNIGEIAAGSNLNMIGETTCDLSSQDSDQEAEVRRSASFRASAASKQDCMAAIAGCQKRMSTSLEICKVYDFWVKADNLVV